MGSRSDWETIASRRGGLAAVGGDCRVPRRVSSSHAEVDVRLRRRRGTARTEGDHRWSRGRGALARHGRFMHTPACVGCARAKPRVARPRLTAVDRQMPGGIPVGTLAIVPPAQRTQAHLPPASWRRQTLNCASAWLLGSINKHSL